MDRRVKERLIGATILLALIVLVVPELLSGPNGQVGSRVPPPAAGPAEPMRNVTVDLAASKSTSGADIAGAASVETAADSASAAASGAAAPGAAAPDSAASDPTPSGGAVTSAETPVEAASGERSAAAVSSAAAPTISTLKAQPSVPATLGSEPQTLMPDEATGKPGTENPTGQSRHGWTVQVGSFANRENAEKLLRRMKVLNSSAHVSSSGSGSGLRYRVRIGPLADRNSAARALAQLRKEGVYGTLVAP